MIQRQDNNLILVLLYGIYLSIIQIFVEAIAFFDLFRRETTSMSFLLY